MKWSQDRGNITKRRELCHKHLKLCRCKTRSVYGIHGSNEGKIVIFGGGFPIRRKGFVIGAIGTSAGTVEQDIEVAEAAVGAIEPSNQSASVGVP
jgi:uncharacterized protein GlcG (DUF336 family)